MPGRAGFGIEPYVPRAALAWTAAGQNAARLGGEQADREQRHALTSLKLVQTAIQQLVARGDQQAAQQLAASAQPLMQKLGVPNAGAVAGVMSTGQSEAEKFQTSLGRLGQELDVRGKADLKTARGKADIAVGKAAREREAEEAWRNEPVAAGRGMLREGYAEPRWKRDAGRAATAKGMEERATGEYDVRKTTAELNRARAKTEGKGKAPSTMDIQRRVEWEVDDIDEEIKALRDLYATTLDRAAQADILAQIKALLKKRAQVRRAAFEKQSVHLGGVSAELNELMNIGSGVQGAPLGLQ